VLHSKNGQINAPPVRLNYEGLELEYLSQRYVKIHGLCRLPQSTCSPPCANSSCKENHHQEYMMARVPQDFKVKWTTLSEDAEGVKSNRIGAEKQNQTDWFKESQCEISSLHSIPKTFLALIQLISALPTIWQGRNDKRGYAAYQLTLVPYALMSLINILCSFLTPNYPTVYMIKSTTMEEAIRRGGQFDGTVGELCETDPKEVGSTAPSVLTFDGDEISFEPEDFSQTKLSEWEKLPLLKMIWDTVTYIYKHLIDEHLRREIYIVRFHWRKPGRMTSSNVRRIFRTAPKHDHHSHLIMLSPFGCPKFREWKTIDTTMTVVADLLLIVSLLVPYIVMGIFSQFRTGTSRWYQRALFITWLVLGQFLYSYQRLLWGYIQARIPPLGTKWLNGVLAILMIAIVIHALAAVGGFVVVGSMIWQDTIYPANATI